MARGGRKLLGHEPVEVEETSAGSVLTAVAAAARLLVGPVRPGGRDGCRAHTQTTKAVVQVNGQGRLELSVCLALASYDSGEGSGWALTFPLCRGDLVQAECQSVKLPEEGQAVAGPLALPADCSLPWGALKRLCRDLDTALEVALSPESSDRVPPHLSPDSSQAWKACGGLGCVRGAAGIAFQEEAACRGA